MDSAVIATDAGFAEGPVVTAGGEIVFVSIDQGVVRRLRTDGSTAEITLGGGTNGATGDAADAVYVAQNGGNWMKNPNPGRREPGMTGGVQRIAEAVTWITRAPVAPNDLCFGPDGCLYVTDPKRDGSYSHGLIWRCDPRSGEASVYAEVGWFCNGIGFDANGDLFVASTGDRRIVRLGPGSECREDVVIQMDQHAPDGFAFDVAGNLLVAGLARGEAPGEVEAWSARGKLLDRLRIDGGGYYTNVALDADGTMVVTEAGKGRVHAVSGWALPGLALHPLRDGDKVAPVIADGLVAAHARASRAAARR